MGKNGVSGGESPLLKNLPLALARERGQGGEGLRALYIDSSFETNASVDAGRFQFELRRFLL